MGHIGPAAIIVAFTSATARVEPRKRCRRGRGHVHVRTALRRRCSTTGSGAFRAGNRLPEKPKEQFILAGGAFMPFSLHLMIESVEQGE